jgi:hypothetical protein
MELISNAIPPQNPIRGALISPMIAINSNGNKRNRMSCKYAAMTRTVLRSCVCQSLAEIVPQTQALFLFLGILNKLAAALKGLI